MNKCGFEFTIKLRENTSLLDLLNLAITDYKLNTTDITEKQLDEQIKEWLYKTKSGKMFQKKMKNTNYLDAINQMIAGTYNAAESVISLNEIDLLSNISKCFGSNTLFEATRNKEFRRNFILKLLFYTRTKTEESDLIKDLKTSWGKIKSSLEKYINNNTDDITTDINSMNSKELIDDILLYHSLYGTLRIDNQKLVDDFQEIVNSVYNYLYNLYHIVQSNEDLNAAIIEFKETQYKILNKFLLREGYVKSPRSQYINREGNVDLTYVIDLLNKMDEYLNVNKDDLSTKLLSIIKALALGQRCDNLLLKAIHAYLNIRHFDETVKSNFGDIINISKYHTFEVSKYSDGKPNIKYFLGLDTSTAVRGWYQGEFRDALSETTKFEKLLIGSLSLIDYKTKLITSDTVDQSKIAMAWYEFIKACLNLTRTDGDFAIFRDIVSKYNLNVNEHITEILNFVFNKGHENILTSLNLPKTTLNIIYSIYSIYLNDNVSTSTNKEALIPIKHVELLNIINGEITLAKYLYQDIIFGIISRVVPANYLLTRIKDGVETTEIASKHNTVRKDSFDFRESHDIKLRRYTQELRKKLIVDKYNIRFNYFGNGIQDNSSMIITIGNRDYKIYIGSASDSNRVLSPLTSKDISTIVVPIFSESEQSFLKSIGIENSEYTDKDFWKESDASSKYRLHFIQRLTAQEISENQALIRNTIINVLQTRILNQLNGDFGEITKLKILSPSTSDLKSQVLEFINDFLDLQLNTKYGLDILSTYKNQLGNSLLPLFHSAVKLAYKNKLHFDYNLKKSSGLLSLSFMDYVKSLDKYINDHPKEYNVVKKVYDEGYLAALGNQTWIDAWFEAKGAVDGVDVLSVTKNANNDNIANFRQASLAASIKELLNETRSSQETPAAQSTLFVLNPNLIVDYVYDSDLEAWDGTKKAVKKCNVHELLYHNIIHNFWNKALCDGSNTISIMPTVYSDKTSFVQYIINTNAIVYKGKTLLKLTNPELEELYFNTIGDYFKNSYTAILNDLKTLFEFSENINLSKKTLDELAIEINNILKRKTPKDLEEDLRRYLKQYPLSTLNVGNDVHYRVNKSTGTLYLNELIHYYGTELFKDIDTLRKRFNKEKRLFLEELIKNRVRFYSESIVLDDSILNTVILNGSGIIYEVGEKQKRLDVIQQFKSKWFKQGRMVLALDKNGNEIFTLSDLNNAVDITLNPILEKYFYVDAVVSSNIKYALVGSEISDPIKAANLNMRVDLAVPKTSSFRHVYDTHLNYIETFYNKSLTDIKFELQKFNSGLTQEVIDPITKLKTILFIDSEFVQGLKVTIANIKSELDQISIDDDFLNELVAFTAIGDSSIPNFDNIEERRTWYSNYLNDIINTLESQIKIYSDNSLRKYLLSKYDELIYRVIATNEGALYKRNVIIPATSIIMTPNSLTGLGKTTKVAIFSDPKAHYFTLNGELGSVDADDGSAFINPFLAILENYSLNVNSVSFTNKKPIWHHYDLKTGTSVLLKFATFTLSNALMLISLFSEYSHYRMFKKLTNLHWDSSVDLLRADHLINKKVDFRKNILQGLSVNKLYYEDNGDIKSIEDFIKLENDNEVYYTKERDISVSNDKLVEGEKLKLVALLFTSSSESFKVELDSDETIEAFLERVNKLKKELNLHSISSLFELHAALGGIQSKEFSNGQFIGSENSNYAVVAFMNTVTVAKDALNTNVRMNLEHFILPLKSAHVGYAANTSAVKRGQFNVQDSSIWTSNDSVIYTELNNIGLGKQQDTDHTADESEVSEMTLVVASLDVMGYTHEISRLAFLDLGKIALEGLRVETETLLKLINLANGENLTEDLIKKIKSDFYDLFGRTFIELFKARKLTDFSNVIVLVIKDTFLKSESHELDDYKLPVSDPNIFYEIMSSFLSTINKKSLKRKYPGLGAVLVPGYKKALVFHINGLDLLATDVIRLANTTYNDTKYYGNIILSISTNTILEKYLKKINGEDVTTFFIRTNPYPTLHNESATELGQKYGTDPQGYIHSGLEISEVDDDTYLLNILNNNGEIFSDLELLRISTALLKVLPVGSKIKISTDTINNPNFNDLINTFNKLNYIENTEGDFIVTKTDSNTLNKLLSKTYLLELLNELPIKSFRSFKPTDIVTIKGFEEISIDLDNINNYYKFNDRDWWHFIAMNRPNPLDISADDYIRLVKELLERRIPDNIINLVDRESYMKKLLSDRLILLEFNNFYLLLLVNNDFLNDVTKPQSLRPQIINFTINGQDANIFDLSVVREAILSGKENPEGVQLAILKLMEEGIAEIYVDSLNPSVSYKIDENSVSVEEAELLMSNIYKSKYNQGDKTLAESLESFSPQNVEELKSSTALLFLKGRDNNISISFSKPKLSHVLKNIKTKVDKSDGNIKVMALSNTNNVYEPIYQLGVLVVSDEYVLELIDGKKAFKNTKNEYVKIDYRNNKAYVQGTDIELIERDGKVYTSINFVEKYELNVNNGKPELVYYFNIENIKKYLGESEVDKYIADVIYKLHKYELSIHIQLNNSIDSKFKGITIDVLNQITDQYENVDSIFSKSSKIALEALNSTNQNYFTESYKDELEKLYFEITEEIKSSYELSRYFIAARIPALSLQSYMKMKLVGYIPISGNECMVSHWLTVLQGSDY